MRLTATSRAQSARISKDIAMSTADSGVAVRCCAADCWGGSDALFVRTSTAIGDTVDVGAEHHAVM
jgi:hypothetical protein